MAHNRRQLPGSVGGSAPTVATAPSVQGYPRGQLTRVNLQALGPLGRRERNGTGVNRPGKLTSNVSIKAFNGRFQQECLNENWFLSLEDAEEKVETW